jgi:predicted RNase H-like HicB family nuclease
MEGITAMSEKIKKSEEYLKDPYSRVLIPDEESGTYTALILEFPGCIAQGDTPQEAYDNLEDAANQWIEAALTLKQDIPSSSQSLSYGGKILLRLPKGLHRQLALIAEREGVSLNQFIVSSLSEKVGASTLYDKLTKTMDRRISQVVINTAISTILTDYTTPASSGDRLNKPIIIKMLNISEGKSNA